MAYDILVGAKVSDLATLNGWKMFKKELLGKGDELDSFIKEAHGDAELLVADLEDLGDDLTDSTQSIVDGMLDSLSGATGDVYITDGFEDDD